MVRQPAVAGQFYSADGKILESELSALIIERHPRKKVLGVMVPHAGYIYSGAVAGSVYGAVEIPETVVILGPNHHGMGAAASIHPSGEWLTPLGSVQVDTPLSEALMDKCPLFEADSSAHRFEHSIEVQVPFLQYLRPKVKIVPICLGLMDFSACRSLGSGISRAIRQSGSEVLLVASSDMTHYEPDSAARKKDGMAIREMEGLNPEGLYSVVRSEGISMCGIIPATVMMVAALELGAGHCNLVRYATSGDVSGDRRQVVGYAGMMVF